MIGLTITQEQYEAIERKVASIADIPSGMGDLEAAGSIAAINLALHNRLVDSIPACMSQVIGRWIIRVQDAMPSEVRNSTEWRRLLPLAAGTGRQHERERLDIILDWMWGTVLPYLQEIADNGGYGEQWRTMCRERTRAAAWAAGDAAGAAWAAGEAAWAAGAAGEAAWAAGAAGEAAWAAWAAGEAAWAAWAARAAGAAAGAAWAARAAAGAARTAGAAAGAAWEHFDPVGLLARLVAVSVHDDSALGVPSEVGS